MKDRAVDAGTAISAANDQATSGVVEQVSTAFTTAIAKLDETTTDPEIGRATRTATARLLDAIKAELTGGDPEATDPPADPGPPKPIEPGPGGLIRSRARPAPRPARSRAAGVGDCGDAPGR